MEGLATAQPWQIVFLLIGCTVVMSLFALWLFSGKRSETEPVTLDPIVLVGQLWTDILHWRPLPMSSQEDKKNEPVSDLVSIPVWDTGINQGGMNVDTPDIDAGKYEMPRLSRDITEDAELAFLCVVRNNDGKYRHSANKIYELIGGDRNTVLAKIKEIRGTPPVPEFRQPDGTVAPATRPVTGKRTAA